MPSSVSFAISPATNVSTLLCSKFDAQQTGFWFILVATNMAEISSIHFIWFHISCMYMSHTHCCDSFVLHIYIKMSPITHLHRVFLTSEYFTTPERTRCYGTSLYPVYIPDYDTLKECSNPCVWLSFQCWGRRGLSTCPLMCSVFLANLF